MARLIIRYPNNVIKEVEFDQPKYKIGFNEDNDLKLENDEVTPHQAEIDTTDGAYSIVDVSDNNSTSVNGKKIDRVNLNYGDRISFGPVIGLFYPSKKGNVSDKTKVVLYVISGAVVIFLSFFLIFYFTSRRLSTVVTQEIGEIIIPETADESPEERRQRRLERKDRERQPRERKEEEPEIIEEKPALTVAVQEKRSDTKKILYREKLTLPEPELEDIKKRDAVAIPRGMRRLFFRKIPVIVKAETVSVIEEKDLIEEVINVVEEASPGGETALVEKIPSIADLIPDDLVPEELRSLEQGSLEQGSLEQGSLEQGSLEQGSLEQGSLEQGSLEEEFTVEVEAGEDAGLLGEFEESEIPEEDTRLFLRLIAPLTRLFKSKAREQLTLFEEELERRLSQEEEQGAFSIESEATTVEAEAQRENISGGPSPGEEVPGEETLIEESLADIEGLTGIDIKLISEPQVSGSEADGTGV
ncbi:MAG TPA: FHA domain-containing protein, partial [Spirochaetes bacterium]|nr:FHA domain-containing protein [Spirochaetota bacterium]